MPQLEIHTFLPQIVWLTITFVILYLVMSRVALPRIAEVLQTRQDRIAHDLDAAGTLKAEAEVVIAAYETAMADARSDAQAHLAKAADERAGVQSARMAELDERIAAQLSEAEKGIAEARQAALVDIEQAAGEIARSAVEKLTGATVEEDAAKAAVTAARSET